jgi:hypothetical protein
MTTYTAKTVDLFWRESTLCDISATTEQEAIDEAFEFAESVGLNLTEIPVFGGKVLVNNEGFSYRPITPSRRYLVVSKLCGTPPK